MINLAEIHTLLEEFERNLEENRTKTKGARAFGELIESNAIDEVGNLLKRANDIVVASVPYEVDNIAPRFSTRYSYKADEEGNATDLISVKVVVAEKGIFSTKKEYISVFDNHSTIDGIINFIASVYVELIQVSMEYKNLEEVNKFYADAAEEAGAGYNVRFVTSIEGNAGDIVAAISDTDLVFIASHGRVMDLGSLIPFANEKNVGEELFHNESFQEKRTEAFQELVEVFKSAPNTARFLADKEKISEFITDRGYNRLPSLIEQGFNRKVETSLKTKADFNALFRRDGVIAGVAREKGELSVSLSPVNETTGDRVEYDVIAAIS